ncbi:MAG: dTMP kinase [archaeon]
MKFGKFIVFEGINGCGKGTQLDLMYSYIRNSGKAVPILTTGEPNDFDENGRKAREMLRSDGDPYSNNLSAVKYFARNRGAHNKIFVPMLEKGINVVSDRYWHSNFAFQSAQGVNSKDIAMANNGYRVPDLTIILDVPVEIAFDRLNLRDGKTRRKFDRDEKFLNKVCENYLGLPKILLKLMGEKNIVITNGARSIEAVFEDIKLAYDTLLKS